jgi:hypothetical protein
MNDGRHTEGHEISLLGNLNAELDISIDEEDEEV